MRYLLLAGGQVLNTGVARRFIRNALWEEGEPYLRIFLKGRNIRLMQVALWFCSCSRNNGVFMKLMLPQIAN